VSESSPGSKPMSAIPQNTAPGDPHTTADPAAEKVSFRLSDPNQACTSVGPFNDITSAARAAGLLAQRGFKLRQRAEEGETIEGYWVYVGGMQSDDEVSRVTERLAKNGFTDAHVMKNYSTNRRVSVGMFSTRERAEKRSVAVKNMGLQPEIGERKFPGTVYWVDVSVSRAPGVRKLPPEYAFAEVGGGKIGTQPCPPPVRPVEPAVPDSMPGDDDGVIRRLPRTTVASAPKTLP
jgi:sporulation related protein